MEFIKSYSKSSLHLTGMIAVSVVMSLFASCTGKTDSGHPEMANDPVGVYGNYLAEVRELDNLSTKELAVHINRWRAAKDSAFSHAIRTPPAILIPTCTASAKGFTIRFARSSSDWPDPSAAPIRTCLSSRNLPLLITETVT